MPTRRAYLGAAVANGKVYAVGGYDGRYWLPSLKTVEAYDPVNNTWATGIASMSLGRHALGVVAADGNIYAIGGWRPGLTDLVEEYNPATNTWTTKASIPTARNGLGVAATSGMIYAIGGGGSSGILGTVEAYQFAEVDTTPPVVTAPPDVTAEATGVLTPVSIGTATATDDVGVVSITSDAPISFPVGTTVVTWTAIDAAGNAGTATQNVTVEDTTAPVVTAPPDVTLECPADTSPANTGTATATDNCGDVTITYNDTSVTDLILYYTFENDEAGIVKDVSGNGNDGLIQNSPEYVHGVSGLGLRCEGNGQTYSSAGDHVLLPSIDFESMDAFTISLWVNEELNQSDGEAYIFFGGYGGQLGITHYVIHSAQNVYWVVTPGSVMTSFDWSHRNQFVLYTLTYGNDTLSAYRNGVLIGQDQVDQIVISTPTAALARHWWWDGHTSTRFTGTFDEVRVYNRELAADEVTALYQQLPITGCCNTGTIGRIWTATDECGNTSSAIQFITVQDTTAPELVGVPADETVECDAVPEAAIVTATDNCDDDVEVTFLEERIDGECDGCYILTRTWTATDDCGNSTSAIQVITVQDTTAPSISVSVSPDTLWPANHKMIQITATLTVSDNCDSEPEVVVTSIESNEPINAKGVGDGNTSPDWEIIDGTIWLRAERDGTGTGRIYTITYTVTDACGNSSTATVEVTVPHDQGKSKGKK